MSPASPASLVLKMKTVLEVSAELARYLNFFILWHPFIFLIPVSLDENGNSSYYEKVARGAVC